ncbi:MAG: hypothetical protein K2M34_04030 [Alphaproteobacteria bacterium]|nr:hypothetical protein [Alphaproteobacteria bacterium]
MVTQYTDFCTAELIKLLKWQDMFDIDWATSFRRDAYELQRNMANMIYNVAKEVARYSPWVYFRGTQDTPFGLKYIFDIPSIGGSVKVQNITSAPAPLAILQLLDTSRVLVSNEYLISDNIDKSNCMTRKIYNGAHVLISAGELSIKYQAEKKRSEEESRRIQEAAAKEQALASLLKNKDQGR